MPACGLWFCWSLITGLWMEAPVAQAQGGQEAGQSHAYPQRIATANAPAEAGGPQGEIGPIAVPKKKDEAAQEEMKLLKAPKKVEGLDNFSMRVASQLVTLDVGVLSKEGVFIPGPEKGIFPRSGRQCPPDHYKLQPDPGPDHGRGAGGVFQQPVFLHLPD